MWNEDYFSFKSQSSSLIFQKNSHLTCHIDVIFATQSLPSNKEVLDSNYNAKKETVSLEYCVFHSFPMPIWNFQWKEKKTKFRCINVFVQVASQGTGKQQDNLIQKVNFAPCLLI